MKLNTSFLDNVVNLKNDINLKADFIELACLVNGMLTIDDVSRILFYNAGDNQDDVFEKDEISSNLLDNDFAQDSDIKYNKVYEYFQILNYRQKTIPEYYPFIVEENNTIIISNKLTDKNQIYLILLLSSNITLLDLDNKNDWRLDFEHMCKYIMKILVPKFGHVEIFGTSKDSSLFKGNFSNRVNKLAEMLCTTTTKAFDKSKKKMSIPNGDGGLDIFSWLSIDNAGKGPISFAQCTCSFDDWPEKQCSINNSKWGNYIEINDCYSKYMYVPFSLHNANGLFDYYEDISLILIDRIRILKLLEIDGEQYIDEIINLYSWANISEIVK